MAELLTTTALMNAGAPAMLVNAASFLPSLGTVATVASVGGSLLSASGTAAAGRAEQRASEFQATQLDQQAGQTRATAQRRALEERRRVRLAQSRAVALAGASGAGAGDSTVTNILGGLEAEGEYRALTALYEGEEQARGLELGAQAKRYEGASVRRASSMRAGTTLFGAGNSLLERYG